ncbi:MAG TPA: DNA-directed RNA polymerase subunit alpha C-terminal domain-containing protein [Candidatus Saccharimonas sp.]|nr:DNA-directed RNA polymerase subunit alpha C-terminal domain-containing protein [Candidatus Saccharimonas sp.]
MAANARNTRSAVTKLAAQLIMRVNDPSAAHIDLRMAGLGLQAILDGTLIVVAGRVVPAQPDAVGGDFQFLSLPEDVLQLPVVELGLPTKMLGCLLRARINTVGRLLQWSGDELVTHVRNFGEGSKDQLIGILRNHGLQLCGDKQLTAPPPGDAWVDAPYTDWCTVLMSQARLIPAGVFDTDTVKTQLVEHAVYVLQLADGTFGDLAGLTASQIMAVDWVAGSKRAKLPGNPEEMGQLAVDRLQEILYAVGLSLRSE